MNQSDPEASIRAAYVDAKARGLPDCWKCSIDKRNRRKWTAPTGRSCDSIPKALAISVELGLLPPDFPIQSGPNKRKRPNGPASGGNTKSSSSSSSLTSPFANKPGGRRPGGGKRPYQRRQPAPKKDSEDEDDDDDDEEEEEDEDDEEEEKRVKKKSRRESSASSKRSRRNSPTTAVEKPTGRLKTTTTDSSEKEDSRKAAAAAKKEESSSSSSSEEEEEETPFSDKNPPEPMNPEISLDGLRRSAAPTTVHWDPTSPNGALIGQSVRVAAPNGSAFGEWLDGRVVSYDPFTHQHKIEWQLDKKQDDDNSEDELPSPGRKKKQSAAAASATPPPHQTSWLWLRNEEHNLHICTRLVWAHVKGYAWWPALVREANTEDATPAASSVGHNTTAAKAVKVEFFGTGEVATLRDSPDSLRPFHPLQPLDAVVAKHKKKRNAKATTLATAEWYAVRHARNQAAYHFAQKAWNMAQIQSSCSYLGKQVQVFRDDVNYPYGDTLTARVHLYSHHLRKWLCSYDLSPTKNAKYEASWLNLQNKQVSTRLLTNTNTHTRKDKLAARHHHHASSGSGGGSGANSSQQQFNLDDLKPEDLLPFLYGFELITDDTVDPKLCEDLNPDELQMQRELSELWQERCHACVEHKKRDQTMFHCSVCKASYHLGCCDPPLTPESYMRLLREHDGDASTLVCSRCITCRGCWGKDICFGVHPYSPLPSSLSLPAGETSLDLCSMCKDAYDRKQYCPNCAHSWDDVKFQKIRRQMEHLPSTTTCRLATTPTPATGPGRRRKVPKGKQQQDGVITMHDSCNATLTGRFSVDLEWPVHAKVDPSWYFPETVEWGYTEIEMLVCDHCKVWVHAGCAGMSEDEYNETSEGQHEIFSQEFLCRTCCRLRCIELVQALQQEDVHSLFAVPVTEEAAPNYADVISEPMDLQTMLERAERCGRLKAFASNEDNSNEEGGDSADEPEGPAHYAWVRESFELMVLNALTFNNYNTTIWHEAKRFYEDSIKNVFEEFGKAAPPGKYQKAILKNFERAEEARKKEEDRVQVDESVEKKDLVAGAMAPACIVLPSLRDSPPDQPSCVPHTEVHLKPVEAFYCAWLDCCFTCGSSGAADTMLFCVDCGEAYHSFCVNAPVHSMTLWAANSWRCPNCKVCEISGDVPADETSLIYCEMCDRAFSLTLLDPPLDKAPHGLWICGQCVDCKVCGNTADPRGASLQHWSRDPEKCFSCGGCQLPEESNNADANAATDEPASCSVCQKLLRGDEPDLVTCVGCHSQVHCRCDPRAERHAKSLESVRKNKAYKPTETYLCPKCYQPAAENIPQTTIVNRRDAYHLAWQAVQNQQLWFEPSEDQSSLDLYQMLTDRIEWEVRARWKEEYQAIIQDGMKFYQQAIRSQDGGGDPRSVCMLVFNRLVNLPLWEAQRALRFVAMAHKLKWDEVQGSQQPDYLSSTCSIQKIVMGAKLAAAYIDVACTVGRLEMEEHARYPKRIEALLQPPEEGGVFTLQDDAFEQGVSATDLDLCDVDLESETDKDKKAGAEGAKGDDEKAEDDESTSAAQLPDSLAGWDSSADMGQPGEWKDPRECCLCHLCGDDDAGLHHPPADVAAAAQANSRWGLPVQLGRLLPMGDGHWIHTSCALWTSEVYEEASDGMIHAVEKARARGAQLKCFGCGRYGATVGCNKSNCSFNFHFPCAKVCGAVFTSDKHVYCANHAPASADVLKKESFEIMKALMVAPDKEHKKPSSSNAADKDAPDPNAEELCLRVGGLVVHSLGEISQKKDGFHTENHITPPGYFASRIFWSCTEPRKRTVYLLQVSEGEDDRVEYTITPAENTSGKIRGHSLSSVYATLVDKVRKVNAKYFSQGDLFTTLPMVRRSRRKTFGLNGPQFFGFGLNLVRKRLERLPGVEAVVSPLAQSSPSYRFCFTQPDVGSIRDLQRRRAAAKAEMALENHSGCARTEGIKAVARSGGSGRITRALVRSAEELVHDTTSDTTTTKLSDRNVYQGKYRKMKAVPIEQRLVARRSHIHGWGLFTKIDIAKSDPIVEYVGEIVRKPIADIRERQYEASGEGSCFMFRLDLHRIVDATNIGSMARFMNHSCSSNAYAKIISVDTDFGQDKKIVVFANRDITAGEEITYDYKFPVEDGSLRCTCGAPNCIGRLN